MSTGVLVLVFADFLYEEGRGRSDAIVAYSSHPTAQGPDGGCSLFAERCRQRGATDACAPVLSRAGGAPRLGPPHVTKGPRVKRVRDETVSLHGDYEVGPTRAVAVPTYKTVAHDFENATHAGAVLTSIRWAPLQQGK
jgi:hypothetical protein